MNSVHWITYIGPAATVIAMILGGMWAYFRTVSRSERNKDSIADHDTRLKALELEIIALRLKLASEYNGEAVERIENRLESAIGKLGDRLERALNYRLNSNETAQANR